MAYAIGHVSGCHLEPGRLGRARGPAVGSPRASCCRTSSRRWWVRSPARPYCSSSRAATPASTSRAASPSNGYGEHSPGGYSLAAGSADRSRADVRLPVRHPRRDARQRAGGFAPIAIGLALTLIHLISIPVTNTSVNPARSTGPALFVGGWALAQLWLFWVAPIVGAALAGIAYRFVGGEEPKPVPVTGD